MSFINNGQTGKVIRFNRRRGFGIIKYNGRKTIFHVKNYCEVFLTKGQKNNYIKFGPKTDCEHLPEIGDRICFKGGSRRDRTTGEQRPCVTAWYYKEDIPKKVTSVRQNKQLGRKNRSKKGRMTKYHNVPQICYV